MPNISTSGSFLGGLSDFVEAIAPIAVPIAQQAIAGALAPSPPRAAAPVRQPAALPGGAPLAPAGFLPTGQTGFFPVGGPLPVGQAAFFPDPLPIQQFLPQFLGGVPQAGGATIRPTTTAVTRLPARVDVPTPDAAGNLRFVTFKNMGRPVLWTGDLAACRRVRSIAKRVKKAGGR